MLSNVPPTSIALYGFGATSGARIGLKPADLQRRAIEVEPLHATLTSYAIADDGARIYYEVFSPPGRSGRRLLLSQRPRPVLLMMGLGATGCLWAPAVRRCLGGSYPVITFDNRGCGRSSAPWRPWTTRTMAGDAIAVLDELGVEQAHVGSVSLGGMAAQELALEFPERVSTLVLVGTTGGFRRLDLAPGKGLLHLFESTFRALRGGSDPERRVSNFLRTAASEDFAAQCRPGDEAWETIAAMLEDPASQHGSALQLLAAIRHSSWSRLGQLSMPVLIHHGANDALIPLAAGRELARRIPGARIEIHEGAGHGLFERTEEVAETNLAFFAEAEAPAGSGDTNRGAIR